jgi:hypothetical protein
MPTSSKNNIELKMKEHPELTAKLKETEHLLHHLLTSDKAFAIDCLLEGKTPQEIVDILNEF